MENQSKNVNLEKNETASAAFFPTGALMTGAAGLIVLALYFGISLYWGQ